MGGHVTIHRVALAAFDLFEARRRLVVGSKAESIDRLEAVSRSECSNRDQMRSATANALRDNFLDHSTGDIR